MSKSSGFTPYFLTGYSSLVLVPIAMLLHTYDDFISVFPAMPAVLSDAQFFDLPSEGGFTVSAQLQGGQVKWITIKQKGKIVLQTSGHRHFGIIRQASGNIVKFLD